MTAGTVDLPLELVEAWPKMTAQAQHLLVEMAVAFAGSSRVAGPRKPFDRRKPGFPLPTDHLAERRAAAATRPQLEQKFRAIGFNTRVARALAAADYDPPRLLAAERRELTWIPNIGEKGLAAIDAYRAEASQSAE